MDFFLELAEIGKTTFLPFFDSIFSFFIQPVGAVINSISDGLNNLTNSFNIFDIFGLDFNLGNFVGSFLGRLVSIVFNALASLLGVDIWNTPFWLFLFQNMSFFLSMYVVFFIVRLVT